jgi:hypothetical protein
MPHKALFLPGAQASCLCSFKGTGWKPVLPVLFPIVHY